jgi:hypothetical protein
MELTACTDTTHRWVDLVPFLEVLMIVVLLVFTNLATTSLALVWNPGPALGGLENRY